MLLDRGHGAASSAVGSRLLVPASKPRRPGYARRRLAGTVAVLGQTCLHLAMRWPCCLIIVDSFVNLAREPRRADGQKNKVLPADIRNALTTHRWYDHNISGCNLLRWKVPDLCAAPSLEDVVALDGSSKPMPTRAYPSLDPCPSDRCRWVIGPVGQLRNVTPFICIEFLPQVLLSNEFSHQIGVFQRAISLDGFILSGQTGAKAPSGYAATGSQSAQPPSPNRRAAYPPCPR